MSYAVQSSVSTPGLLRLQDRGDGAEKCRDMSQAQMLEAFSSGTVGVFASYSAALGQIESRWRANLHSRQRLGRSCLKVDVFRQAVA
ncbi:hypothetical protein CN204_30240 [Sinorhizobium meliloti]|nr:hypothetical protein SMRU11_07650 [Sinorhizobium meliloti RU11/001]PST22620.1 hypothetical protein C7U62_21240 [Mesorhizobium loti]RVG53951.1 hypothetical protein CN222_36420 [Sinorhizobium meliloti]RVG84742.1 hypothetical protein CN221_32830 [Sinorhizobium meliloti]RVH52557.1 hypothetical protein CN213_25495 [Sinorhizobium meliloti]